MSKSPKIQPLSLVLLPFFAITLALGVMMQAATGADAVTGKAEFDRLCAACHGESGKGDGFLADVLSPPPGDLTLMRKKMGYFSFNRVYETVDGRANVRAHGSGQMPIWGTAFDLETEGPTAHARIVEIMLYLERLQA